MNTPLLDLDGVGPMTLGVFQRAGFNRVGELFARTGQEHKVRVAAEAMATEQGTAHTGHWRALASRCVSIIKRIRNPQYTDVVPEVFLCPITFEEFEDPVITPCGRTYERSAIERALQQNPTDPETRKPLAREQLVPNRALKDAIALYNAIRVNGGSSCSSRVAWSCS